MDAMGNLDLDLGVRTCQSFVHRRSTTPVYRRPRPVELSFGGNVAQALVVLQLMQVVEEDRGVGTRPRKPLVKQL